MLALSKVDQDPSSTQKVAAGKIVIEEVPFMRLEIGTVFDDDKTPDSLDQLIDAWRTLKDRRAIDFSYKVSLHYHILQLDHGRKQISIGQGWEDIVRKAAASPSNISNWQAMPIGSTIEATQLRSLTPRLSDLLSIEPNLMQQRQCLEDALGDDQGCFTMNVSHIVSGDDVQIPATPESYRSSERRATDLRVTFNAHDLREARHLHDQLCVLGPIMCTLTANDPGWESLTATEDEAREIYRGMTICPSTQATSERSSVTFVSPIYLGADAPKSDTPRLRVDQSTFWRLRREGFDDTLATLFARDVTPTIQPTRMHQNRFRPNERHQWLDCLTELNPYTQLQLPILDQPESGFRVEFSGINAQLTDFAHAACVSFVALLRFAILGFDLDFRLSPEKAAENMRRSQIRDATTGEKFWWRMPRWRVKDLHPFNNDQYITTDQEPTLICIDHIVNGDPSLPETIGLSGVVEAYLADTEDDFEAGSFMGEFPTIKCHNTDLSPISSYLAFIRTRAKGTTWTDARWIDTFVRGHREHIKTGAANPEVLYDLFAFVRNLNRGGRQT